jgi:hypothetical protein
MRNSIKSFSKIDEDYINLGATTKAVINKGRERNATRNGASPSAKTVLLRNKNMF